MSQVPNQYHVDDTAAVESRHDSRPVRPLLWWLLAVAAVAAAAIWFTSQRSAGDIAPLVEQAPVEETVPVDEPAAATAPRPAATSTASKRTAKPAVAQHRQARPLASNVTPKYPPAALRSGIGGTVLVRAEIDASGKPVEVKVARRSGNRDLDRAALNAVRSWRFEPAMRDGRATTSVVQVPVDFKPI
ncbi:energy transducer TonB [Pseudoxanthomonas wuyuanensis]|uniref:Outer membrane transport energization protein TonB n=1 Tax=Pseudoxanthomonas wuyuanensis TaxID=1073196 RepID=A0A286CZV4_9GAMM|nr:energy transducer TonB [Pseudoxanthomonas wuyuanensis]KAF1722395.1 energy transducer TonB [Pseudoxanthomonas wuyuanensis]SOD51899.1 outer membrane transport energization protein TonB [Pseudoxanthomonas wuyuanensis]